MNAATNLATREKAAAPRLWIQATPSAVEATVATEGAVIAAFAATLVSSGVGALLKAAADRLLLESEFTLVGTLALDTAFRSARAGEPGEFMLRAVTLNVGTRPAQLDGAGDLQGTAADAATASGSPVLVRVEFRPSRDGTAIAGHVTHWVYDRCLDERTALRDARRKVTIEIKVTDVSGATLLATAMQVSATTTTLPMAVPGSGDRLPWVAKPSMTAPSGSASPSFGPVNIQVRLTEAAGPSWLGRLLGNTLSGQAATIEASVRNAVTQVLDAGAASRAQLATIDAAQAAWTDYVTAHQKAKAARDLFSKDGSGAHRQALVLALAVLSERLALARETHRKAGLPLQVLEEIPAP